MMEEENLWLLSFVLPDQTINKQINQPCLVCLCNSKNLGAANSSTLYHELDVLWVELLLF